MTGQRYATPAAMRAALEQRLRGLHNSTGLPLDRLRKEVALQRLLARIAAVAPVRRHGRQLWGLLPNPGLQHGRDSWTITRSSLMILTTPMAPCRLSGCPFSLETNQLQPGMRIPGPGPEG